MDKELLFEIGKGVGTGLGVIGVAACSKRVRERVKKFFQKKGKGPKASLVAQDKEIQRLLFELRFALGADRVYVWRFHNGSYFAPTPASSIWRLSKTHEVVKPGVSKEAFRCQGILFSHLTEIVGPVITGKSEDTGVAHACVHCGHCKEGRTRNSFWIETNALPDCMSQQLLNDMGVVKQVVTNLHANGNTFGMLGVDFCSEPKPLEKEQVELCCTTAERLQYLTRDGDHVGK